MDFLPSAGVLKPFGVLVHSTGDGLAAKIATAKEPHSALSVARSTYESMGNVGPHYCIEPDGGHEQYAATNTVRYHCAVPAQNRRSYLDGHWTADSNRIPKAVVEWWQREHPGVASPSHLYPGEHPNNAYIGIELIPCGVYAKNSWQWRWGTPPGFDSQRFSVEQYCTLARLCIELAVEHSIDLGKVGRLVGHEDVSPYSRPGYDPGAYHNWFSWPLLRTLIQELS